MSDTSLQKLYSLYRIPGFLESLEDTFLKELLTLLVQAGSFALSIRELSDLRISLKGVEDFVTVVDIKNQDYLVAQLLASRVTQLPDSPLPVRVGFVLEEDTQASKAHAAQGNEDIFVYIDPIDGTTSYKDGGNDFAIGVSIQSASGNLFYSVVYIPTREEIIIADQSHDRAYVFAAQGEKRIIEPQPSHNAPKLKRIAAHYNPAHKETLLQVYSLLAGREVFWYSKVKEPADRFGDNPVPGSLMIDLIDLARDKYDIVINGGCHLWDLAPAQHVLTKTGYELVDWSGKPLDVSSFKGKDELLKVVAGKKETLNLFFETIRSSGITLS